MKKLAYLIMICVTGIFCYQCDKNNEIHVFSVAQDKELGRQVDSTILAEPSKYPILDRSKYPAAYQMIENIKTNILNSNKVAYKDEFEWKVTIINDPNTLNAFATPGGYIYVYTGLIKYLDREDDLAGVMGHEIAHADRRHSIEQMEKAYGLSILLSIITGQNSGQLQKIAGELAANAAVLAFSRGAEKEADEYSVRYLEKTSYKCNAASCFFQKLEASGEKSGVPEFLSTHPNPANRVADINKLAVEELKCVPSSDCSATTTGSSYASIKASLP